MRSTGVFDAKKNFSALIDAVEAGEEVRITRHGKEVVRMLPMRRRPVITDEQVQRELSAIDELHARIQPSADDDARPAGARHGHGRGRAA